jgi:hypothetical protein
MIPKVGLMGASGSVVEGLCYKLGSSIKTMDFSIDLILPAAP